MLLTLACYADEQVAELHGRLHQAQEDNAKLLSNLQPAYAAPLAADTCSSSAQSETSLEHSAANARQTQASSHSSSSAPGSQQQVQHSGTSTRSSEFNAALPSPLLSGELCKTLQQVVDSLTADAAKLTAASQQQAEHAGDRSKDKAFNWGFSPNQSSPAADKAGPVRPATAAPSDGSKQRPRRQWSAQHVQPDASSPGSNAEPQRASRPFTAADDMQRVGSVRNRHQQHRLEDEYFESVPPTRMREDVLRQAREDYIKEKNRVRDKRLQELTSNASVAHVCVDGQSAESTHTHHCNTEYA